MSDKKRFGNLLWVKWANVVGLVLILSMGLAACGDSSPTATNTRTPDQVSTATDTVLPTFTAISQPTLTLTSAPGTLTTITLPNVTTIAPPTTNSQTTNPATSVDTTSAATNSEPTVGATVIPVTVQVIPPTKTLIPPIKTPPPPTKTKVPATPTPTLAPASNVQTGKLRGHIVAGPTCPVQRVDSPCPPRPVVGRAIYVKDQQTGNLLQTLTSDVNGYFGVDLKPGTYIVEVAKVGIESDRSGPHKITLVAGQTVVLEIEIDTGMRLPS